MSQPFLIDQILNALGFNERTKSKKTPAVSSKILHLDKGGEEMQTTWEYRRIIGQLNFLEKLTRPDIAYAVHQCTRFLSDPRASHKMAILRIRRYLMATRSKGIVFEPDNSSLNIGAMRISAKLESGHSPSRPQHGQVQIWVLSEICRMPFDVGIEDADGNGFEHN